MRFGGHHAAVGVTLKADKIPEFTERLCRYMDELPPEDFIPRVEVDASVDLSELTLSNVEKLDLLAPFGQENVSPHFLAHGVMMAGGVIVPMNQRKSWDELHRELELVEPSAILTDGDDYGCNEEMQAAYGSLLRPWMPTRLTSLQSL